MADFPSMSNMPPVSYHTYDLGSPWSGMRGAGLGPGVASIAHPSANLAIYYPMHIPVGIRVARVFWGNGSAVTGTRAFAIYSLGGALIYSTGSVAVGSASALQYVTPTPFWLPPGRYYFCQLCSATTNALQGSTSVTTNGGRIVGLMQQAVGSTTPPTTMTPAQWASTGYGLCGITRMTA